MTNAGLKFFEKTEFITNTKSALRELEVAEGKIIRQKYQILTLVNRGQHHPEVSLRVTCRKMAMTYQLTNKRSISLNAKLLHYYSYPTGNPVRCGVTFDAWVSSVGKNCKSKKKDFEKILGSGKIKLGIQKTAQPRTLYTSSMNNDMIWGRKISFYGHMQRLSTAKLTNRTFIYILEKKNKGCLVR